MTDIVEQLRDAAKETASYHVGDDTVRISCGTLRDAAAEIERLRAVVIFQDVKLLASNPNMHVTPIDWRYAVYACEVEYTEIKHDPEPWGSAYAMNKENWA